MVRLTRRGGRMGKRAVRVYVPEEIAALLSSGSSAAKRPTADETLALVVRHARGSLPLSAEDRAQLHAEWAERSAVVFVKE